MRRATSANICYFGSPGDLDWDDLEVLDFGYFELFALCLRHVETKILLDL